MEFMRFRVVGFLFLLFKKTKFKGAPNWGLKPSIDF